MTAPDFRAVFEGMPGAFLLLAADAPRYTVVAATEDYLHATLSRRDELVGRLLAEIVPAPPDVEHDEWKRTLQAALDAMHISRARANIPFTRYRVRRADGTVDERYWSLGFAPIFDSSGALRYIVHDVEDATTERSAQERAAESEGRFRTLADDAPVMLWVTDPSGYCTYINRQWLDFTGQSFEEALGAGWLDAVHPDDVARAGERFQAAAAARVPFTLDYRLRRHDGVFRWAVDAGAPRFDESGEFLGFVGSVIEISERKEAEAEREQLLLAEQAARREADEARRQAEAAAETKSQFLAAMSHEIRTPINAIIGYAQLLNLGVTGPINPAQRDHLDRLESSGRHLLGIVNDVLDLAKTESGRLTVTREEGVTGDAVGAAIGLLLPQAAARRVHLLDCTGGDAGASYYGDPQRVKQIVVNLLSNAVKFTHAGGRIEVFCGSTTEPPATVRLTGGGPWAYIRVEDTGIGIAVDQQALVFEPFVQAEGGHTRSRDGTGLGLTISRRLARMMGGDLTLESTEGKGSTFTLWLPAFSTPASDDGKRASVHQLLKPTPALHTTGLAEVGRALRESMEDAIDRYGNRIQSDRYFPGSSHLSRADVEDHALTLVANMAQSLVIIEDTGQLHSPTLKDGGEIQHAISLLHGRQRRRLGWTETHVERDYAILYEELEGLLRRKLPGRELELQAALEVIRQLMARAWENSARALKGE